MLTLVLSALLGQSPIVLPPRQHKAATREITYETRYEYRTVNGRRRLVRVSVPVVRDTASRPAAETYTGGGCQVINGVRVCPVQR